MQFTLFCATQILLATFYNADMSNLTNSFSYFLSKFHAATNENVETCEVIEELHKHHIHW